jgi:hypothetical protein
VRAKKSLLPPQFIFSFLVALKKELWTSTFPGSGGMDIHFARQRGSGGMDIHFARQSAGKWVSTISHRDAEMKAGERGGRPQFMLDRCLRLDKSTSPYCANDINTTRKRILRSLNNPIFERKWP